MQFCENLRLRGRRSVFCRILEICPSPTPSDFHGKCHRLPNRDGKRTITETVSNGTPDSGLPSWFYGRGSSYKVSANCSHPRTASHPLCGEQCGQPRLLSPSVPASGTPRTRDVLLRNVSVLSSTCHRIPGRKHWHGQQCAAWHDPHSTSRLSASDSPDACMASSVFSAWHHHFLTPP